LTDTGILQRLIQASAPAMAGCTLPSSFTGATTPVTPVALTCPGGVGSWTLTMTVTPTSGGAASSFASLSPTGQANIDGGTIEIKAVGAVSLLAGFATGGTGLSLSPVTVQGDAAMVIL
jgi:hypothetical protein